MNLIHQVVTFTQASQDSISSYRYGMGEGTHAETE